MAQEGLCQFHLRWEVLCKSHLLPKSFVKYMKDQGDELAIYEVGHAFSKRVPGGVYDKGIMCATADQSIGIYDEYASKFFRRDLISPVYIDPKGRRARKIQDFDFDKLTLFLMSYIWRCHHAKIPMFKNFDIGEKFAEKIRQKLVNQDASSVGWFDFVCFRFEGSNELIPYKSPWSTRAYDRNVVVSYFLNWKVVAKLDSQQTPRELAPFVASKDRAMVVACEDYEISAESKNDLLTFRKISRNLKQ